MSNSCRLRTDRVSTLCQSRVDLASTLCRIRVELVLNSYWTVCVLSMARTWRYGHVTASPPVRAAIIACMLARSRRISARVYMYGHHDACADSYWSVWMCAGITRSSRSRCSSQTTTRADPASPARPRGLMAMTGGSAAAAAWWLDETCRAAAPARARCATARERSGSSRRR